jgi:hypothetical protein
MKRPPICNLCHYPVYESERRGAQHDRCALLLHILALRAAAWDDHQVPLPFSLTRSARSPRPRARAAKLAPQMPGERRSRPRLYLVTPLKPAPRGEIIVDLGSPQLEWFPAA